MIEPVQAWIRERSQLACTLERTVDPLAELPMTIAPNYVTEHVVLSVMTGSASVSVSPW